jgi:hypothetical protein
VLRVLRSEAGEERLAFFDSGAQAMALYYLNGILRQRVVSLKKLMPPRGESKNSRDFSPDLPDLWSRRSPFGALHSARMKQRVLKKILSSNPVGMR